MPLYEYLCVQCGTDFNLFRNYSDSARKGKCPGCGVLCKKLISRPSIVTDTNFGYTGKYDPRLGGPRIEGRKDFFNRLEAQGKEVTDYAANKTRSNDTAKRLKEQVGLDIDMSVEPAKWGKQKIGV